MRELLGQPTAAFGDRRKDQKRLDLAVLCSNKDAAILEAAQSFRFDHEMQRRQAFRFEPLLQALVQFRIVSGFFDRPLADRDALVSCPV